MERRHSKFGAAALFQLAVVALLSARICAAGGLSYTSVAEAGLNEEALAELQALLEETKSRAAVVLHKGKVVAEWYWQGEGPRSVLEVWSTSKSIVSTAIGILIDEGKIGSIEEPVSKYVPNWDSGDKAKVTIAHLLDQVSGLEEVDGFPRLENQLEAAITAEIITPPGEVGRYNNAGCNVLSAIISAASGKDPEAYMREKVWEPLGMDQTWWRRDKAGHVITYAGVQTTAMELARFGQMLLDGGVWNGERIVSEKWIELATNERTRLPAAEGIPPLSYGLLWWLDFGVPNVPHNYNSLGLYGNNMTIFPDLDLVGVRLVGNDPAGSALMMKTPQWVTGLAKLVQPEDAAK